jgi:hypothetical protein
MPKQSSGLYTRPASENPFPVYNEKRSERPTPNHKDRRP